MSIETLDHQHLFLRGINNRNIDNNNKTEKKKVDFLNGTFITSLPHILSKGKKKKRCNRN